MEFWINARETDITQLQSEITWTGKRFAKSQSCVMMDTASFFNWTLIEPLLVQNDSMFFASQVFYTWTIDFCDRYINFYLCRLLCQRTGLLIRDLRFSGCFCSIEPSLRLCDRIISKSTSCGFLWMINSDSPLRIKSL